MSSFFADMLAGAAGGLGQGMVSMADQNRLDREKQNALDEKSALALELQRQKSEDLRYRTDDNNLTRMMIADARNGGGGSGGKRGGGDSGMNLMQLAMQAKTPEDQDQVVKLTRLYAGDDAAAKLSEQMFSRPIQETVDLNRANNMPMNDDEGNAMPSAMVTRNKGYDKDKGAQALQRMFVLAMDPAKTDDQAKAERQQGQTDMAGAAAGVALRGGEGIDTAAEKFATLSNPALNTNLNDIQRSRIEASTENAATRATSTTNKANADRASRELLAAQKAVETANKMPAMLSSEKAAKAAAIATTNNRLKALTGVPGVAQSAPASPGNAKSAADAFKFANR